MISVGDRLPDATLIRKTGTGMEQVPLADLISGRRVVIVGVPGAYSGLCDQVHLPSFIRTRPAFDAKGIEAVICIAVNDPFVMDAWGNSTGAAQAGIEMLADADGGFTRAIGMSFDAPVVGFYGRSTRYAMLAEDGIVRVLNTEEAHGICDRTAGETLLEAL